MRNNEDLKGVIGTDLSSSLASYTWAQDPDQILFSAAAQKLYGGIAQQLCSEAYFSLIHPEDRPRLKADWAMLLRDGADYSREFRIQHPDGSVRVIHDTGTVRRDSDGRGIALHGVQLDVSRHRPDLAVATQCAAGDAKAAQEPLFYSQVLSDLIEKSPFGVYVLDDTLTIVMASKATLKAFAGIDPVIGCAIWDALRIQWPEDMARDIYAHFENTLKTGESYNAPSFVNTRQDRDRVESYDWQLIRTVLPDGRFGVVCHFYDLSEREAQESALRDATERLEMAYEAADMAAWDFDLNSGDAVWTNRMNTLLGVDPDTPSTVDTFLGAIHPDDRDATNTALHDAVTTGATFDADFRVIRPDGEIRHLAGRGRAVDWQDDKTPARLIGVNYDATKRRQIARQLRESENRVRVVLDNSIAFTGLLDLNGTLIEANRPALDAAGITREDVIGRPFWEASWWNYDPCIADQLKTAIRDAAQGKVQRYDVPVRMLGDTLMMIDFMLAPTRNEKGDIVMLVASAFDITERTEAAKRIKNLMDEINHRSKNLLTLVDVIARQTARSYPDDFIAQFNTRLRGLAAAQDLLVRDVRDGAHIDKLIESQLAHFEHFGSGRLHLTGPEVFIPSRNAQAVGMVFHELSTNASKYGAWSNDTGHVTLNWEVGKNQDGLDTLVFDWVEHGGPPVVKPSRKGFGSFVITAMVADTMAADVDVDYMPTGFRWRATCREGFQTNGTPGAPT